jgi:DNA-binding MarR family transcriptional regulator
MASTPHKTPAACFVVGDDGLSRWSDTHPEAWIGFLETHRQLSRALDHELEARHRLSMSAVELLGRLAAADERRLRLSRLAADTGLSLSRVSRIVDALEARGLVERRPCPSDARAINAHLTGTGLALAREAQATHFADVQRRFFDQLEADEVALLARLFSRFVPRAGAQACDAGRAD